MWHSGLLLHCGPVVGQLPDGPLFLLLAPQALTQEQVLGIAEHGHVHPGCRGPASLIKGRRAASLAAILHWTRVTGPLWGWATARCPARLNWPRWSAAEYIERGEGACAVARLRCRLPWRLRLPGC